MPCNFPQVLACLLFLLLLAPFQCKEPAPVLLLFDPIKSGYGSTFVSSSYVIQTSCSALHLRTCTRVCPCGGVQDPESSKPGEL